MIRVNSRHRWKREDRGRRTTCIARKPKRRSRRARIPAERVLRWSERYPRGIQMRRHESREPSDAGWRAFRRANGHGVESRARELVEARATSSSRSGRRPSRSRHHARVLLNQSGRSVGVIRTPTCRQVDSSPPLRTQKRTQERLRWVHDKAT